MLGVPFGEENGVVYVLKEEDKKSCIERESDWDVGCVLMSFFYEYEKKIGVMVCV